MWRYDVECSFSKHLLVSSKSLFYFFLIQLPTNFLQQPHLVNLIKVAGIDVESKGLFNDVERYFFFDRSLKIWTSKGFFILTSYHVLATFPTSN